MSNEKKHYADILQFLMEEMESFIRSRGLAYQVLGGKDTPLATGIQNVCRDSGCDFDSVRDYADQLGQLYIDIFVLVVNPDNGKFEVILCEVKDIAAVGLKEYSQLMGYCLSSYSRFGLLVNVDRGVSKNMNDLLSLDVDLRAIRRILFNHDEIEHKFGCFAWNTSTRNLETLRLGSIVSVASMVAEVCKAIE